MMIAEKNIKVNGEIVVQRGKKIRKNDIIEVEDYDKFVVIWSCLKGCNFWM